MGSLIKRAVMRAALVSTALLWSFCFVRLSNASGDSGECEDAPSCPSTCLPPDCQCSGTDSGIPVAKRPQIVYLTFDDGLTGQASDQFYTPIFNGSITNPNGCNIGATHYITHSYTDYSLVNHYWHMGHEIAVHSITHRNNLTYWREMDIAGWEDEMVGVRKMVAQFAAIDPCVMTGMRAPFLQGGGDVMFDMLKSNSFTYDSSWPTRSFGYLNAMNGLFPYTLDYATAQDCEIEPCPTCSHDGIWIQPMIDLEDEWVGADPFYPDNGMPCSMLDACVFISDMTKEHVYNMLMKNFKRVYSGGENDFGDSVEGNRAPWGLYMHAAWFFGQPWHFEGYKMFLDEISSYDDVWIVPVQNGIEYMKNPLTQEELLSLGKDDSSPFGCNAIENKLPPYDGFRCGNAKSCRFDVDIVEDNVHMERYMKICTHKAMPDGSDGGQQNCPDPNRYPWLGDHCGGNEPCADCPK